MQEVRGDDNFNNIMFLIFHYFRCIKKRAAEEEDMIEMTYLESGDDAILVHVTYLNIRFGFYWLI